MEVKKVMKVIFVHSFITIITYITIITLFYTKLFNPGLTIGKVSGSISQW